MFYISLYKDYLDDEYYISINILVDHEKTAEKIIQYVSSNPLYNSSFTGVESIEGRKIFELIPKYEHIIRQYRRLPDEPVTIGNSSILVRNA
jgi:hypothetical protein